MGAFSTTTVDISIDSDPDAIATLDGLMTTFGFTPGKSGGAVVDFVGFNNLNDDASTASLVPVDIGLGLNPMIINFVTTRPNQRIEMKGTASGVNVLAAGGFAINFALDGVDVPNYGASSGPIGPVAGTAAILMTIDIQIPGPHTVSLRWKTLGAGTAKIHAATVQQFEGAGLSVWGYTSS
jgi:hypothetical protein